MWLRRAVYVVAVMLAVAVPAAAQINFPNFSNSSAVTLNGTALITNNGIDPGPVLRVVPAIFNSAGSGFASREICVTTFSTSFRFRLPNAAGGPDAFGEFGADGFTFALTGGPQALGGLGGSMGLENVAPSVAVEFDTWFNPNGDDPNSNHVGINVNGDSTSVAVAPVPGLFNDGALWSAWIDYNGTTLEVRVSNTGVRPAAPTLALAIDIPAILGAGKGYAGFTAGTGGATGNHDIVSWTLAGQCGNLTIDGCDSGVDDHALANGTLFSTAVQGCAISATNHGGFVSCVAGLGTQSMKAGSINGRERGAIQSCAARSSYYKGPTSTDEFIENGGFETGDKTGWLTTNTGIARWTINNGTFEPAGPPIPQPPIDGAFDLVADQTTVHVSRAMQVVDVPLEVHAATLSWSDRLQNSGPFSDPGQEYRVVIRRLDTSFISEVFSTGPADAPVQLGPNARSADLTAALQALKGQRILISFEQRVDAFFFALALDQVSLTMTYR